MNGYLLLNLEDNFTDSFFRVISNSKGVFIEVKEFGGGVIRIPAGNISNLIFDNHKKIIEQTIQDCEVDRKKESDREIRVHNNHEITIQSLNNKIFGLESSLKTASQYIKMLEDKLRNMENRTINLVETSRKLHDDLDSKLLQERVLCDNLSDFANVLR